MSILRISISGVVKIYVKLETTDGDNAIHINLFWKVWAFLCPSLATESTTHMFTMDFTLKRVVCARLERTLLAIGFT